MVNCTGENKAQLRQDVVGRFLLQKKPQYREDFCLGRFFVKNPLAIASTHVDNAAQNQP
jgi:hypothetical protein